MIDWSWTLLDEAERTVLRRLAVHPGTLDLAAAEAICADDLDEENPGAVAPHDVVDVLIGLVERSMVTTCSTPTSVRYGLLESIATYRNSMRPRSVTGSRSDTWIYLALAHKADRHLRCSDSGRLPRLEDERTHRNAFGTAVDRTTVAVPSLVTATTPMDQRTQDPSAPRSAGRDRLPGPRTTPMRPHTLVARSTQAPRPRTCLIGSPTP